MNIPIQYTAIASALCAILAWTGIWYIGNDILNEASARAALASSAQVQSDRAAYTQRLSALVADTEKERATLEEISGMNIVSIVSLIEGIGKKTGVPVKVNSAQPQGASVALPNNASLRDFSFITEADGSFAQIMSTVRALENLPVPSSVTQLEITRTNDAQNSGGWHLSARIEVYTTSSAS